jgi:hypothetical protein
MFRKNLLPPSSGQKLLYCTEDEGSEKFANIYQNTRLYIPEVSNIHQQWRLAHFH